MTPEQIQKRKEILSRHNQQLQGSILAMENDIKLNQSALQRNLGMLAILAELETPQEGSEK